MFNMKYPHPCNCSCPVIPVQSNAFTVASADWSSKNWPRLLLSSRGGMAPSKRMKLIDSAGEFLAAFCAVLRLNPSVMAHRNSPDNVTYELAQKVKTHLDKKSQDEGSGGKPSKSVLVILDRGMDIRTVFMHDICLQVIAIVLLEEIPTYFNGSYIQPLAFDLLPTKGDLYTSNSKVIIPEGKGDVDTPRYEFSLTDEDQPDWRRLRYLPMPQLLKELQKEIQPAATNETAVRRQPSRRRILRRSAKSVIDYETIVGGLRDELKAYLLVLESNSKVLLFSQIWPPMIKRLFSSA